MRSAGQGRDHQGRSCVEAFEAARTEASGYAQKLNDWLEDAGRVEAVDWGDVGTMRHVAQELGGLMGPDGTLGEHDQPLRESEG